MSLLSVLLNTLILVVAGGALALLAGSLLAWVNERTDADLGAFGDILPLAPLMVPPIAGVIGWVVLLDPAPACSTTLSAGCWASPAYGSPRAPSTPIRGPAWYW